MSQEIDISTIISQNAVNTYFQPIVSIREESIIGLESLARGIGAAGNVISPDILFESAEEEGLTVELDRLCRRKALASFKYLIRSQKVLLAVNFKTSIIDHGVVGSHNLLNQVLNLDLDPGNIVIEIVESEVKNINALADFVQDYKEHGFLIALDDFGSGYSNLDRVATIKPDIIKIDRSLIQDFNLDYYKQEMVKSLIHLSHSLGALVLAEGVEREEEVLLALELGTDLFQGYYFSKPIPGNELNLNDNQSLIRGTASKFKRIINDRVKNLRTRNEDFGVLVEIFVSVLSNTPPENFEKKLFDLIGSNSLLECGYILNVKGIQITDAVYNTVNLPKQKRSILSPAVKGTDQSMKEYFQSIQIGLSEYITEPYISATSGNACVTISALFTGKDDLKYIVCLNVRHNLYCGN